MEHIHHIKLVFKCDSLFIKIIYKCCFMYVDKIHLGLIEMQ